LEHSNRQTKPWIEKPKYQVSVYGRTSAEEAKATRGGKLEGRASVEEAKAQASKEEAKGQVYQASIIENKEG